MFSPIAVFNKIYRSTGDRGALLIIFFTGFIIHTFFALQMEMMSIDPNEYGVAAWTALYNGKNWSGTVSGVGYFYGYTGALIYTPLMLFIKDPFIQYKAMLILNGFIVSFIPVFAYRISNYLDVRKTWHRVLVSITCGLYSTAFAHTKFIWNETACVIFPWLLLFLLLRVAEIKNKPVKYLMSVLTAFAVAAGYSAHPRLLSLLIAVTLTVLFAKIFMKKQLVYLTAFLPSLAAFMLLEFFLREYLIGILWNRSDILLQNTISSGLQSFTALSGSGGITRFFQTFFGHLYYLATSTWGLGALAFCLIFILCAGYFKSKKRGEKKPKYGNNFILLAVFAFLSNLTALLTSVMAKFNASGFEQYQDSAIFGRYMDSVIPLLIMLVISYVFIYSLEFTKLLWTIITLGFIYAAFFLFTVPVTINAGKTRVSPILGLYPIRIGENIDATITLNGLFLTVSSVFCFIALFVVIVCCAKRYRAHIISVCMVCTMLYSSLYTAIVYLPFASEEARAANAPIYEISEHIYNSADAPLVYAYKLSRKANTLLQYLNQETLVIAVSDISDLPENCFIVTPNSDRLVLRLESSSVFRELAQTAEYTIYAYGERATAFAQSQEVK